MCWSGSRDTVPAQAKPSDMTRLIQALPMLGLALTTSCHFIDDEDLDILPNLGVYVPAQVQDFVDTNYNGLAIEVSILANHCHLPVYALELADGPLPDIELYFDLNWNFLFEATDIPDSALPAAVLSAIQTQFPGYVLESGQSERLDFPDGSVQYEVALENGTDEDLDVVLTADGIVVCMEQD
jgi:hypothetical protein